MATGPRDRSKPGKAAPGKAAPGKAAPDKAGQGNAVRPRHYGIERWVDFARGLAPEGVAMKMTRHAEGCAECRDLMNFCAKVTATARRMALQQEPRTSSGTA